MRKHTVFLGTWLLTLTVHAVLCHAQGSPTYRLLVYGLPNFERQNSENVIAQNWGIEFYPVAGCEVTRELVDSVARNNANVEPLIEKRYGKNWQEAFYSEVDSEFAIEQRVAALISKLDYVRKKDAEMDKEGNGLHYTMTPVAHTTTYKVSVSGWGKWNGKDEWVTYYKLLVDHKKKTLKLVSESVTKD